MRSTALSSDPEKQPLDPYDEDDSVVSDDEEEKAEVPPIELEEDMFGAGMCSLMRDAHFLSKHKGNPCLRWIRMASTLGVLILCVGTQIFLLEQFKRFVTSKAVHDIREAYDLFEVTMYDETELTVNGYRRGVGTFFPSRFMNITEDEQSKVCRIPLSQPEFFFVILCIWTLSCTTQIKRIKADFQSLIMNTKHCDDMAHSQTDVDGDAGDVILISALTRPVKAALCIFVLIPRLFITLILLWLGCRWLLATNNFADLVLNAVALEFVLCLKDSLYLGLMSNRNKNDLKNTQIAPPEKYSVASIGSFTGSISWFLFAVIFVWSYIGIPHHMEGWQTVLPEYRWDVQHVCLPWIKWRYCVDAPCPTSMELPGNMEM